MTCLLVEALDAYKSAAMKLERLRREQFPEGCSVRIASGQYHGLGEVVAVPECPLDQIAVRIENGNLWWYPLETATRNS